MIILQEEDLVLHMLSSVTALYVTAAPITCQIHLHQQTFLNVTLLSHSNDKKLSPSNALDTAAHVPLLFCNTQDSGRTDAMKKKGIYFRAGLFS